VTGTELVPFSENSQAHRAALAGDLAVEDFATEREKWETTDAADQRVVAAYKALEEGRQLISLTKALRRGGADTEWRPHMAIAPSTLREVHLETWTATCMVRYHAPHRRWRRSGWSYDIEIEAVRNGWNKGLVAKAVVPTMPPQVRAVATRDDLIFWEAEWRHTTMKELPRPRDPALLEHVVGDLYVVKASWELSELEMAALGG
jgi:hypothetical protein